MATLAIAGLAAAGTTAAGYGAYSAAAYTAASMAANLIFKDKTANAAQGGTQLTSLDVSIAAYGTVIPKIYGTIRTNAQIVWAPKLEPRKRKQRVGQKGIGGIFGGQKQTYEEYYYSAAFLLCDNEIKAVRKILANNQVVYDMSETNVLVSNILQANSIAIYTGTEDQMPDPTMTAKENKNISAMRGQAYVVINSLNIGQFGNVVPNFTFEVVGLGGEITYIYADVASSVNATTDSATCSAFDQEYNRFITFQNGGSSTLAYFETTDCSSGNVQRKNISNVIETYNPRIYKTLDSNYILNNNRYIKIFNSQLNFKKMFDVTKFLNYLPSASAGTGIVSYANNRENFKNYGVQFYNQNTLILSEIASFEDERFNEFSYIPFIYESSSKISAYRETNSHCKGNGLAMAENFIYFAVNNSTNTSFDIYKLNVYMKSIQKAATVDGYYIDTGGLANNIFMIDDVSESLILSCERVGAVERTSRTIIKLTLRNFTKTIFDVNTILKNKYPSFSGTFLSNDCFNINGNRQIVFSATGNGLLSIIYANIDNFNIFTSHDYMGIGLNQIGYQSTYYNTTEQSFIFSNGLSGVNGKILKFIPDRVARKSTVVSAIMSDLSLRAGLKSDEISTVQIAGIESKGYIINNDSVFRSNIEQLQTAYDYTTIESDYKIKFVKNQQNITKIIYADEMGAMNFSPGSDFETYTTTRASELDLPTDYDITYLDINDEYNQNNQKASTQSRILRTSGSTDLAVVFDANEAQAIAKRILFGAYAQRENFSFSTNYDYLDVEVNDIIQIEDPKNDVRFIVKIIKKDYDGGIIKFEGVSYSSSVHDQYAVGGNGEKEYTGIKFVAKSTAYILDIPLLTDEDFVGSYVASAPATSGEWDGSVLLRSTDGAEYSNKTQFYDAVTAGYATTLLGNFLGGNTIDYMNSITVKVNDELESISEDQFLNVGNLALLGNELIQFKNAEIVSDKTYKLTGLLRGRYNTEEYINTHVVSENFILLDATTVQALTLDSSLLNRELLYKNVSIGLNVDAVSPFGQVITGQNQVTYQVSDVQGGRNNVGDLKVSFKPCVRGNAFLQDYVDAIDLDGSSYEVDIISDGATSVVRTISFQNANTFTYTASQQNTDFGGLRASITMRIYKMNKIVGRGKVRTAIL